MKKRLQGLVKCAAFVAAVYVALRIIPAEGWYIATAIAIVWLFLLSKQIEGMVKVPTISSEPSLSVNLAIPPPLRAKYIFLVHLNPNKISEHLQLTPDERATFSQCERWPRAIQVDQWGELLRWRFYIDGQDAAVSERDTERDEWITFWEADLESGKNIGVAKLVLDWGEGQMRLYADNGRFATKGRYPMVDASIDHTDSVLMAVTFPDMNQHDRARYRDAEYHEFMEKYGGDFPSSSEDNAERYQGETNGVEWNAHLYDYRPSVIGKIVKSRTVEEHIIPESRRQFLVEIGTEGERCWVPSNKIEPDKNGNTEPPDGVPVFVTLVLNDEGKTEIARVRTYRDAYGTKP
jgi:hypothetical protein